MRVAGVKTIEQANEYLTNDYLAWWERELTVEAANSDDAHRPLDKSHNLAASLSHVETRQVRPDYTLRWDGKLYQIERQAVTTGLRRDNVRVEERLDGSLAVRHGERYLPVTECAVADQPKAARPVKAAKTHRAGRGSDWNRNFDLKKAPKIWQAAQESGCRQGEE
jgi:D-alanyl-D-alanine carboxypeptidase